MEHKSHKNCEDALPAALPADSNAAAANMPSSRRSPARAESGDSANPNPSSRSAGSQSLDRASQELTQAAEAITAAAQKLSSGPELFVLRDV